MHFAKTGNGDRRAQLDRDSRAAAEGRSVEHTYATLGRIQRFTFNYFEKPKKILSDFLKKNVFFIYKMS